MNCDGAEDVILAINLTKNLTALNLGGVLCAKASMLFQVSALIKDIFFE